MAWEIRWESASEDATNAVEAAEDALRQITEHGCQAFQVRRVGDKDWIQVDLEEETVDGVPYNNGGCRHFDQFCSGACLPSATPEI